MGFISLPLSEEVTKFEEFRKITIFANIIDNYLEFQYLSVSHLENYETRKILNFSHFFQILAKIDVLGQNFESSKLFQSMACDPSRLVK